MDGNKVPPSVRALIFIGYTANCSNHHIISRCRSLPTTGPSSHYDYIRSDSKGNMGPRLRHPSQTSATIFSNLKFMLSVIEYLGRYCGDYMLVLCQKLHIGKYDRQNFSPSETSAPNCPKVEWLDQPRLYTRNNEFTARDQHSTTNKIKLPIFKMPSTIYVVPLFRYAGHSNQ